MNNHIEQALADLRNRALKYERPERYYNGEHDLKFATEKFENTFGTLFREFALNLCPVVCDAVRDKLRITGFRRTAGCLPAGISLYKPSDEKGPHAGWQPAVRLHQFVPDTSQPLLFRALIVEFSEYVKEEIGVA